MLVAYRLAGLSALEAQYAGVKARATRDPRNAANACYTPLAGPERRGGRKRAIDDTEAPIPTPTKKEVAETLPKALSATPRGLIPAKLVTPAL
jgi:hypothetical protein